IWERRRSSAASPKTNETCGIVQTRHTPSLVRQVASTPCLLSVVSFKVFPPGVARPAAYSCRKGCFVASIAASWPIVTLRRGSQEPRETGLQEAGTERH